MNKTKIVIILILLISLFNIRPIIEVSGIVDSVVGHYVIEKQISAYSDDAFLFVNTYFTNSTTAIPLNNNQYGIMIGLRFQDVGLNASTSTTYETIETCRLSFYTTDDYPVESGDTWLTIYGIKDSGDVPTFSSYQDMVDRELYFSHGNNVNFNTLVGDGEWWNTTDIRVSTRNIVKTTEKDIGFIMYAESGGASRLFRTFEHNSSLAVKLYIMVFQWETYNPEDEDDYVDTHRGLDIFKTKSYGLYNYVEYVFSETTGISYDNSDGDGPYLIEAIESASTIRSAQRNLIRVSETELHVIYYADLDEISQIYTEKSIDNGITWNNKIRISTYENMTLYDQKHPTIAIDFNHTLQVVWSGKASGYTTDEQIWYTNYTDSWTTPLRISTLTGMIDYPQTQPFISVDSTDQLHVVWDGETPTYPAHYQIWYTTYNKTTWSDITRISTKAGMATEWNRNPTIAIDSSDNINIAWYGMESAYPYHPQIYHRKYTNQWGVITRVSTLENMGDYDQLYPAIAVDTEDNIYITWAGEMYGYQTGKDQILIVNYTTSWGSPVRISTLSGMSTRRQDEPSIFIDSDNHIHVMYHGMSTEHSEIFVVFYSQYVTSWLEPVCLQPIVTSTYPSLRWSRWGETPSYNYIVKDENGTTISPELPTIQDAIEWINDYLAHSGGGVGEGMGDLVIALMGLAGFIMIPLSFIIFIKNMQSGDVENAFYMLMVLFFMGIAFIVTWLWG